MWRLTATGVSWLTLLRVGHPGGVNSTLCIVVDESVFTSWAHTNIISSMFYIHYCKVVINTKWTGLPVRRPHHYICLLCKFTWCMKLTKCSNYGQEKIRPIVLLDLWRSRCMAPILLVEGRQFTKFTLHCKNCNFAWHN